MTADAIVTGPEGGTALVYAIAWIEGTILGTIATTLAVIVIAGVGLSMLSGRINVRRGITTIVGCFILFGARGIAAGLQSEMSSGEFPVMADRSPTAGYRPPPLLVSPNPSFPPATPFDPYEGASVSPIRK